MIRIVHCSIYEGCQASAPSVRSISTIRAEHQHEQCGASTRQLKGEREKAITGIVYRKVSLIRKLFLSLPAITMYKIIASLYRFNTRGSNRSIPYFATLTNLLALFILCLFIIIGLLNMQSVLKFWHTGSKGGDYLIGAVIVVPLYLLMFRMFPERKMKEQEALLTKKEYQLGLFSYVFLVIILMITLFVISK